MVCWTAKQIHGTLSGVRRRIDHSDTAPNGCNIQVEVALFPAARAPSLHDELAGDSVKRPPRSIPLKALNFAPCLLLMTTLPPAIAWCFLGLRYIACKSVAGAGIITDGLTGLDMMFAARPRLNWLRGKVMRRRASSQLAFVPRICFARTLHSTLSALRNIFKSAEFALKCHPQFNNRESTIGARLIGAILSALLRHRRATDQTRTRDYE